MTPGIKRNEIMRPDGTIQSVITADTPLTPQEQKFVTEYIRTSSGVAAARAAGVICDGTDSAIRKRAKVMLDRPNVQAEIQRVMDELRKESVATADEVMSYFTKVMRGQEKDQFGLDAPLSERTRAAQELAKRTVDLDNRKAGIADQTIAIKLDWNRE